jgi:acetyl-CoA carboxylase biotin carboxyl carrier protein
MTEKTEQAMKVDVDLVRQLAELLDATALTEIEVEHGDRKIRVARKAAPAAPMACLRKLLRLPYRPTP